MRTIDLPAYGSGHSAPLTHVGFRSDGQRLATCSYDGTVIIWDTGDPSRPTPLARLRHRRLVNASAWNPADPEVLATASADKTVAIWRVGEQGRTTLHTVLARHTDDINSVAWLPDGERLICVSEDGRATLWSAVDGAFLAEAGSHEAHCMMVSVSAQGLVATVGEDGLVAVSDPDTGAEPRTRRYDSSIEGCAWSHSGRLLAVARDDGAVDLLTADLEVVRTVPVSTSAARAVAWAQDDSSFVVGAYDGALHYFDVVGTRLHRVEDRRVWPRSVAVAHDVVAVGSFWNGPHLYDLTTGQEIAAPDGATHGPNALAQHGDELLIGTDSGLVVAVTTDASGTGTVRTTAFTDGPILSLATDGDTVYAGTYSGHVLRHDGTTLASSTGLGAPVPSLTVHDGTLVAGTYNGQFLLLAPGTLDLVERIEAHDGSVKSLTTVTGGFLSAATDRTVEAGGPHARSQLWQHGNLVNAVAALGTEAAASASRDHTVKVGRLTRLPDGTWHAQRVQTLLGPDESVKCVALLGDAERPVVVAGSYDFGLYAWQVDWNDSAATLASGRVLAEFAQGLSCMLRLTDGTVAVAGWDGRLLIIGLDSAGRPEVRRSLHLGELLTTDATTYRADARTLESRAA
ncbi:WD40 repeat domain-containing protein [Streptomyces acidicola]|uniref:WD40 repeat domain-containing protein n=1 Tax=Streptomyces acidicola TaxID=2596892 RepID=A0A5N8X021_9ACTN|nr:WD40 repeat domain-containing protein [Streptomyces acidicola]MPY52973.1 WD40 repeat domain-containing protein [Streptomyces acidicola]